MKRHPATETTPPASGPRTPSVDWTASREVSIDARSEEWKLDETPKNSIESTARSVMLPAKIDFFEHISGLAVNPRVKRAVVGYSLKGRGDGEIRRRELPSATWKADVCWERRRARG